MEFTKDTLFFSQVSYNFERNIVNYLYHELESKEKRTHEGSSLKVTI